jgi:predicted dehydrogenase
MVGFNRRFAPFTQKLRDFFDGRREPMMLHVRVNAGFIPRDHWAQQRSEGGRVIGELCHFVDWTRFVAGVPIVSVTSNVLPDGNRYSRDNVAVSLSFRDGSIANILYLANGDKSVPKELFEVFCEGSTACIRDFCALELTRGGKTQRTKSRRDKGHRSELERTVDAMRNGHQSPIPFEELMEVSEVTIAVEEAIVKGQPIPLQLSPPATSSSVPELCTKDVSAR